MFPLALDDLPSELKQKILSYLSYQDLGNVCLVSRSWRAESESPLLWENFTKNMVIYDKDDLEMVIRNKKLANSKHLKFHSGFVFSNEMFQLMMDNLCHVQRVEVYYGNFSSVPAVKVAAFLGRLQEISIRGANMTDTHKIKIFGELEKSQKLRSLRLVSCDLKCIPPLSLATVMSKLHTIDLVGTDLTSMQKDLLFSNLAKKEDIANYYKFSRVNLSTVSPEVLARGLVKVETLQLLGTNLTKQQARELFELLSIGGSSLKKLIMWGRNSSLASVDKATVAAAVNKLEEVQFLYCDITAPQIEIVLQSIDENTCLKSLHVNDSPLLPSPIMDYLIDRASKYCKIRFY